MTSLITVIAISLLIQFFYWHFIFRRAADDISPASKTDKERPFLSVVICFHKEWDDIPPVFDSLDKQSYRNFEIILVNDGPVNFHTRDHDQFDQMNDKIRYVRHSKTRPGKKDALAAGIEASKAEWIVVTDIDCEPGPDWLKTLTSYIPDTPAILLGFSPYDSQKGLLNFIIQQETLLTAFQYLGWARSGYAYMGVGRNMAYHKSIYEEITFDSHRHIPTGDDDLFVNEAARYYPVFIYNDPAGFVISMAETSWPAFYHQKTRHKSGGKYYSTASKFRLGLFMVALFAEKIALLYLLFVRIDIFLIFVALKTAITTNPLRKLYRRFDDTRHFWKMWLYEWLHIIYLMVVAPFIFFKTKKEWE